jgi:hypothetical protein
MIAQMKQQLGYGNMMAQGQGSQGQAQSGWGLGVSPYAVTPAPADPANQVEDRQGDASRGDTEPIDYEQLYASEDYAHSFSSEEQLHGQFDLSQPPKKVEEVNSIPESQEALAKYIEIIGAYAEGEEQAVALERIPLEYQELVKQYFSQIKQDAGGEGSAGNQAGDGDESAAGESGGEGSEDGESGE